MAFSKYFKCLFLQDPWTATMLVTIAAATSVQQDPLSHVNLTRPLGLDFGNGHFARQEAVAARVRFNDIVNVFFCKP